MAGKAKEILQFKIQLNEIEPPIWRSIQIPADYTFWDLHVAITDSMGWFDYHLHEFRLKAPGSGAPLVFGMPYVDEPGSRTLADYEYKVSEFLNTENRHAEYIYDFGDGWIHTVDLEAVLPRKKGKHYPVCVGGERACPPEDCGGVPGYEDFLRAINDPEDEDHDRLLEWVGAGFDPDKFSPEEVRFDDPALRYRVAYLHDKDAYKEILSKKKLTYINRKDQLYFLCERAKGPGRSRYYMTMNPVEPILEELPEGYEIHEAPNARVYCRRIQEPSIRPEEKATVESAVKVAGVSDFMVDIKRNAMVVCLPEMQDEFYQAVASALNEMDPKITPEKTAEAFRPLQEYVPMLRFKLEDKKERRFIIERFCFMQDIDDWIYVDGPKDLKVLANKYCKHLNEETFYEL